MRFNNRINDKKAQARAQTSWFGGEKFLKHPRLDLRRDSNAGISHLQGDGCVCNIVACRNGDLSPGWHGIPGINQQVDQDL